MIKVISLAEGEMLDMGSMKRLGAMDPVVMERAQAIVDDVRTHGDAAVRMYTEKFDGAELEDLLVDEEAIEAAGAAIDPEVRASLDAACAKIRSFHENMVPQTALKMRPDGSIVGYRVAPLASVGLYVPGGRASYPSTVLMNAIPAKAAGVGRIVMATPPSSEGKIAPELLYAARIAGVDEIYAVGGAQGVAALAFGTESIAKVDKIVGPGNVYVAAAKSIVSGTVGIDLQAGPSEVLILADETADPTLVAADLLSQAEHDPDACCYLVVTADAPVDEMIAEVERLTAAAPRREIIEASLSDNGLVIVCEGVDTAIDMANEIAPEHLEVMMRDPMELVGRIRNAGAIFVGPWTPVAIGDYIAGPSHTLPTSGTARFSNPLTTDDFVKKTSVISYSREALAADAGDVVNIARSEGFEAHAQSVIERANRASGQA